MRRLNFILLAASFLLTMGVISFTNSNNQVKEVSAASNIDDSQRYWILNMDSTYGLVETTNHNCTKQAYDLLSSPFVFTPVREDVYTIRNLYTNDYILYESGDSTIKHFESIRSGYSSEWIVVYSNGYHYIKTTETKQRYFRFDGSFDLAYWNGEQGDKYRLNLLSFDDATSDFVTAMRNISCDDGVTAPKVTGDNSWESANTAYSGLISPAKNYLRWIKTDKDASNTTIEWAMSKYDYIVSKYNKGTTVYTEFVTSREIERLMFDTISVTTSNKDNNTAIIILMSALTISITLGTVFYFKKKVK